MICSLQHLFLTIDCKGKLAQLHGFCMHVCVSLNKIRALLLRLHIWWQMDLCWTSGWTL